MQQRAAQKSKVMVTSKIAKRSKHRRSKIAKRCYRSIARRCSRGSKHREAIKASRSDVIVDRGAIEASRSDAPGASQMMTRRGIKGEAPPARHHRAIADAPPGIINSPSRVSNFHILGKIISFQDILLDLFPQKFSSTEDRTKNR